MTPSDRTETAKARLPTAANAAIAVAADSSAARDPSGVAWVHDELRRSLEAAHKLLRRHLRESESHAGSDVSARELGGLRQATSLIHQSAGALNVVGSPAAARVLDASEAALRWALQRPTRVDAALVDKIEQASFAVIDWLSRLKAGRPVSTLHLFPQLRVLLETAGAERVHPADLWFKDWHFKALPVEPGIQPRPVDARSLTALEQLTLANIKTPSPLILARISDFHAGAAAAAEAGSQRQALWQLAAAVFQALAKGLLHEDVFNKRLGSRLLSLLRSVHRGQESDPGSVRRLAHDLLFFCVHAGPVQDLRPAPRLAAVRAAYDLETEPRVDYSISPLGRFDPALMVQARKRVSAAKGVWSAVVAGEVLHLGSLVESFSLLADSLRRMYEDGAILADQLETVTVRCAADGAAPGAGLAMEVATALLYVEAAIEDVGSAGAAPAQPMARLAQRIEAARLTGSVQPLEHWIEYLYGKVADQQSQGTVVQELRTSMAAVEQQLDQFFRQPLEPAALAAVPAMLQAIHGALLVIGIDQGALAVQQMRREIEAIAADNSATLSPERHERLAANVGMLGFLFDMLGVQPALARTMFRFDVASARLHAQGQGPLVSAPVPVSAIAPVASTELPPAIVDQPVSTTPTAVDTPDAAPMAIVAEPPSSGEAMSGEETDTELQAIFSDEAGQLLATARSLLTEWKDGRDELTSLGDLRRVFHTLKGSARMVGRVDVGELAWEAEQRYNARRLHDAAKDEGTAGADPQADLRLREWTSWTIGRIADLLGPPAVAAQPASADDVQIESTEPQVLPTPLPESADQSVPDDLRDLDITIPGELDFDLSWPEPGKPEDAAPQPVSTAEDDWLNEELALPEPAQAPEPLGFPADLPTAEDLDLELFFGTEPTPLQDTGATLWGDSLRPPDPAPAPAPKVSSEVDADDDAEMAPAEMPAVGMPDLSFITLDLSDPKPLPEAQPLLPEPEAADTGSLPAEASETDHLGVDAEVGAPMSADQPDDELAVGIDVDGDAADDATDPSDTSGLDPVGTEIEVTPADQGLFWPAPLPPSNQSSLPPGDDGVPADVACTDAPAPAAPAPAWDEAPTPASSDASQPAWNVEPLTDAPSPARDETPETAAPAPAWDAPPPPAWSDAPQPQRVWNEEPVREAPAQTWDEPPQTAAPAAPAWDAGPPPASTDAPPDIAPSAENLVGSEPVRQIGPLQIPAALFNIFVNEADELSRQLCSELAEWAMRSDLPVPSAAIERLHALTGSSATVGYGALGELARELESALQREQQIAAGGGLRDSDDSLLFSDVAEEIRQLLHQFAAGFLRSPSGELMQRLALFREQALRRLPPAHADVEPIEADSIGEVPATDWLADIRGVDRVEAELFPIFEEEAQDLLPQLAAALGDWARKPDQLSYANAAMRNLHTFKGGARLAGAMRLGELAHRLETRIEALTSDRSAAQAGAIETLLTGSDTLQQTFDALRESDSRARAMGDAQAWFSPAEPAPPAALPEAVGDDSAQLPAPSDLPPAQVAPLARPVVDWSRFSQSAPAVEPSTSRVGTAASQASIKVRASLLERMVTQASEVNMSRARIEVEMGQVRAATGELGSNIDRLRQQLHDLELQAETQISSRSESVRSGMLPFDPLEIDRFTRLQELTRMIAESVNDVATVQRSLKRNLQRTEDELAAQTRLTRDLQSDLLRTRMVEFDTLEDRLQRVVRQTANQDGKQVELQISGGNIELDRSVLDRLTPVLEHLVRNAVIHGIETPDQRTWAGKLSGGQLQIDLHQHGNDVGIDVVDDGAGLDLARIRARAEAMGQWLADGQETEMIFRPGFSTAERLTEMAGRGVGLDVVRNELTALAGQIEVTSSPGQGCRFSMLLPLTTAMTQVLMLRCGDLTVALPATMVERVRHINEAELAAALADGFYLYGDLMLPMYWLGSLFGHSADSGEPFGRSRPLIIAHSGKQRVALRVDETLGQQEAVIRHLGPQLSRIPGLVGMSMLASGSVALIYNPLTLAAEYGHLARSGMLPQRPSRSLHGVAPSSPLVLVVDDSLTVRRVTQRLLMREGYRVELAKDGIEALERIEHELPGVVLSDIEMPRMDGYELVGQLRSVARTRSLPVVMITSRIADRHRVHAESLGVARYFGKPYTDEELLAAVADCLKQSTAPA